MTEWEVVGVIAAIIALVASIAGPIIKLNTSITKLTVTMEHTADRLEAMDQDNHRSHERLWRHMEDKDGDLARHELALSNHDQRLRALEHRQEEEL